MTRSRCIFPLIPCLCTLFRLACYISREAFLIIVPVKKYRLPLIRFDTGIFRRCIGTLTVLSYRCGPLIIDIRCNKQTHQLDTNLENNPLSYMQACILKLPSTLHPFFSLRINVTASLTLTCQQGKADYSAPFV